MGHTRAQNQEGEVEKSGRGKKKKKFVWGGNVRKEDILREKKEEW